MNSTQRLTLGVESGRPCDACSLSASAKALRGEKAAQLFNDIQALEKQLKRLRRC